MLREAVKCIAPAVGKSIQLRTLITAAFCNNTTGAKKICLQNLHMSRMHSFTPCGGLSVTFIRHLSVQRLTNSLELITTTPRTLAANEGRKYSELPFAISKPPAGVFTSGQNADQPPLCIIIGWLMSKRKHIMKYAQFYLDQGFDVLSVSCSPWQLLWPVSGGKVIARDILTFMGNNRQYRSTVLHGFSVGGYVWGQLLVLMNENPEKYQYVLDMMVGQIWDSVVDVEGVTQGIGGAVFPNNVILKTVLESYVKFHVNTFQERVMQHYLETSVLFHNSIIRTPSLFFCSEDDPVALHYIVNRIADRWERNGAPVYMKSWKNSPHVSHMWRYPVEYKSEMKAFLDKIGMLKYPEKFQIQATAARN